MAISSRCFVLVKSVKHQAAGTSTTNPATGKTITGGEFTPNRVPATAEQIAEGRRRGVAIPPAALDVKFDPRPSMIVTWRDKTGKEQGIRTPAAIAAADANKFAAIERMEGSLPGLRRQIRRDLALPDAEKKRAIAAAVWIIDNGGLRVGGEESAEKRDRYVLVEQVLLHRVKRSVHSCSMIDPS